MPSATRAQIVTIVLLLTAVNVASAASAQNLPNPA